MVLHIEKTHIYLDTSFKVGATPNYHRIVTISSSRIHILEEFPIDSETKWKDLAQVQWHLHDVSPRTSYSNRVGSQSLETQSACRIVTRSRWKHEPPKKTSPHGGRRPVPEHVPSAAMRNPAAGFPGARRG